MDGLDRITFDPQVMGGRACIRGTRVTASMLVSEMATGRSADEVLADFPYLEREDLMQAMRYAAWLAQGQDLPLPAA